MKDRDRRITDAGPAAADLRRDTQPSSSRPRPVQAALTESRNFPTSSLRWLQSPDSDCAARRTCDEAESVSLAPRCTSVMLELTCLIEIGRTLTRASHACVS